MLKHNMSALKEKINHGNFMMPMNTYNGILIDLYLHWHDEMELIFIKSGKGNFNINLSPLEVSAGDVIIVPPAALHSGTGDKDIACDYSAIVFDLNMLKCFDLDSSLINFINPILNNEFEFERLLKSSSNGYDEIINTLCKIHKTYEEKNYAFELEIKSLFFHLISLLFVNNHVSKKNNLKQVENKTIDKIKIILNYIHKNYNQKLTIKALAEIADFSEYHFIRFFKKHTGQTFVQYLNNYRLEKAVEFLINTKLSVTDVSLETGFENISYFIKTFKRRYYVTPEQFRKDYLNQNNYHRMDRYN